MKYDISVVITYCSNDSKFINHNIQQCLKFTKNIVLVYSNHLQNGTKENLYNIKNLSKIFQSIHFVKQNYQKKLIFNFLSKHPYMSRLLSFIYIHGNRYWICHKRYLGFLKSQQLSKYTLFLDADEIPDGSKFKKWLSSNYYKKFNVIKLANYWYFRKNIYQATTFEDSPVLVKNKLVNKKIIFNREDRHNLYKKISQPKKRMALGLDNKPMIHHYCWARSKENMLKKTKTWGHKNKANWEKLIEKEFSHPFNGTDFVQGYNFKTVKPFINFKL